MARGGSARRGVRVAESAAAPYVRRHVRPFRLIFLALFAWLLMPAEGWASSLAAGELTSGTAAVEAPRGEEEPDVAASASTAPDEPDDDESAGEAGAPSSVPGPSGLGLPSGDAAFGARVGIGAASGIRYGLFRPPRHAA